MPKSLVIVESPAKARTISSYLGSEYKVVASFGHVRDLPEGKSEIPAEFKGQKWAELGVNVDHEFEPIYVVPDSKKKYVSELKNSAKDVSRLLLATDEDREGESISWHVLQLLKPKRTVEVKRIVFHEITPEAIKEALENPRDIDDGLVRAQEARRILDRLYGYTLSPLLWRKVAKGLSAGRVQSVAVRLVVAKERERRQFRLAEYFGLAAKLGASGGTFSAKLQKIGDRTIADGQSFDLAGGLVQSKAIWLRRHDADALCTSLQDCKPWRVTKHEARPGTQTPPPPFMTSTLQQEANRKLGLAARRTMQIAQSLYEGVDIGGERVGLITYMRTDSLALAARAVQETRDMVARTFGKEYVPEKPRVYKSKAKNAQEAHEAIRPTQIAKSPHELQKYLDKDQFRLYELIWKRTLACQMPEAKVERLRVEVTVTEDGTDHMFHASGKTILFPGYLRAYAEGSDDPEAELADQETVLPAMKSGDTLVLESLEPTAHKTTPPARYTEASLVQKLEAEGVGRPSTYASIIGTIEDRGYTFHMGKEIVPTWTAFAVTGLLEGFFSRLVDLSFTAKMEEELDDIALGKLGYVDHLKRFYHGSEDEPGLTGQVQTQSAQIPFPSIPISEDVCVRIGRNGPFLQRGEGGPGNTASVPDDLPPADLSDEIVSELFERKASSGQSVGAEPNTGREVLHKKGRFGDYLELQPAEGAEAKRVTVPPGDSPSSLSQEDLAALFSLPKSLGNDPESGNPIVLAVGRYGAYLTCGEKRGNVGEWRAAMRLTIEEALEKLRQGPSRERSGPVEIKQLAEGIRLLNGRYGPYVTDGQVNATLPKGRDPESITLEEALQLIKDRAAAGPKKRPFRRGARAGAKKR